MFSLPSTSGVFVGFASNYHAMSSMLAPAIHKRCITQFTKTRICFQLVLKCMSNENIFSADENWTNFYWPWGEAQKAVPCSDQNYGNLVAVLFHIWCFGTIKWNTQNTVYLFLPTQAHMIYEQNITIRWTVASSSVSTHYMTSTSASRNYRYCTRVLIFTQANSIYVHQILG